MEPRRLAAIADELTNLGDFSHAFGSARGRLRTSDRSNDVRQSDIWSDSIRQDKGELQVDLLQFCLLMLARPMYHGADQYTHSEQRRQTILHQPRLKLVELSDASDIEHSTREPHL